jgi:AcrR family transcriptional regulator
MSDVRLEVLSAPQRLGITVAEACRRYRISRDTFYAWQRRYRAEGVAGLQPRSRRPKRSPRRTDPAIEKLVVQLRRQHPRWGARRLHGELARRELPHLPTTATVHAILKRNGLIGETRRRADTKPRRGATTRQALIDAAIELWAQTGWQVTGIAAVAERVGVTDSALLHHFDTKENFLLHVLAELDRRELARVETWSPGLGLDTIRRLPDMARAGAENPGLWKLHNMLQAQNLEPGSRAYEYYVRRQHYNHNAFADAVRTGQEHGEIRPDANPELVAGQIVSFLLGMGLHAVHGPQELDGVAMTEDFTERLVRDLATAEHPEARKE